MEVSCGAAGSETRVLKRPAVTGASFSNLIRAEFSDHVRIVLRSSRDHACTYVLCELHSETATPPDPPRIKMR